MTSSARHDDDDCMNSIFIICCSEFSIRIISENAFYFIISLSEILFSEEFSINDDD